MPGGVNPFVLSHDMPPEQTGPEAASEKELEKALSSALITEPSKETTAEAAEEPVNAKGEAAAAKPAAVDADGL